MLLKRAVVLTVVVTENYKKRISDELRQAMERVDANRGQIQFQLDRYVNEVAKSDLNQAAQIREKLNEEKARLMDLRSALDARMREVEKLEIGNEYRRGEIEGLVEINIGDNLYQKLAGTEVIVKDGIIIEIREREDITSEDDIPEDIIEPE